MADRGKHQSQVGLALPSRSRVYGAVLGVGGMILGAGLIAPFVVAEPTGSSRSVLVDAAPIPEYDTSAESGRADAGSGATVDGDTGGVDAPAASGGESAGPNGRQGAGPSGAGTSAGAGDTGSTAPSGPTTGAPSRPGGANRPSEPLTASDTGITPDTVKLGILAPNQELGGVDISEATGDIVGLWRAYVDEVNESGGVSGRQVEPVIVQYDGLSQDDMRAACAALAQDHQVFAVVNAGGYYGDPILCLTEQYELPSILQASEARDYYVRSQGRYFSVTMEKERTLVNFIRRSVADGQFEGHKIGILDREGPDQIAVDNAFVPEMARQGIPITHRSTISQDFATAQNQLQLEVQEMQRKGVDLVFFATGFTHAAVFAQNAESQGWYPQYAASDFASATLDTYAQAMPPSFAGAYGYTALRTGESRVGLDEAAQDAACREVAERRTGEPIQRDSGPYVTAVTACGILDLFVRGFEQAGPNPTRAAFSAELASIGSFDGPYAAASSFRSGKWDSPDAIRAVSFSGDCRCWVPTAPFKPAEA